MQGQFMPNVSRPQMTSLDLEVLLGPRPRVKGDSPKWSKALIFWGVANPPVVAGNIQYGPCATQEFLEMRM